MYGVKVYTDWNQISHVSVDSLWLLPLHLLVVLLLPSLSLHLLHFDGVRFAAAHVQLMVAHAKSQNALVDAQSRSIEHKVLKQQYQRYLLGVIQRQIINPLFSSCHPVLTYWCFLVNWLDDELLVIEGNVPDFTPRKSNFGRHSVEDNAKTKKKTMSRYY